MRPSCRCAEPASPSRPAPTPLQVAGGSEGQLHAQEGPSPSPLQSSSFLCRETHLALGSWHRAEALPPTPLRGGIQGPCPLQADEHVSAGEGAWGSEPGPARLPTAHWVTLGGASWAGAPGLHGSVHARSLGSAA